MRCGTQSANSRSTGLYTKVDPFELASSSLEENGCQRVELFCRRGVSTPGLIQRHENGGFHRFRFGGGCKKLTDRDGYGRMYQLRMTHVDRTSVCSGQLQRQLAVRTSTRLPHTCLQRNLGNSCRSQVKMKTHPSQQHKRGVVSTEDCTAVRCTTIMWRSDAVLFAGILSDNPSVKSVHSTTVGCRHLRIRSRVQSVRLEA